MHGKKILLVDDSDVVLEANRIALEDGGYAVVTVDNPFSVPYLLRKEKPDLVLLDVNMPTMAGDLVARIVSSHPLQRVPIILYSTLPEAELAERVKSSGATGFLRKTSDRTQLLERVKGWLTAGP